MSKTITINKSIIFIILLSFILGFGILFLTEHFGEINAEYRPVITETDFGHIEGGPTPLSTPLTSISYYTPYGSLVKTGGNGFTLYDLKISNVGLNKYENKILYVASGNLKISNVGLNKYENKILYIASGTKKDCLYGILYSVIILIIIIFFRTFKIRVK